MICEKCKGKMNWSIEGATQGWRCPMCGWNIITTYIEDIDRDETEYSLYIKNVTEVDAEKIKFVAKTANVNFVIAKQMLEKRGSIIFLMGLAQNVLGYRHPAAILDRSKNKCCGLITDSEELKNNQLCFSVDTTVLHLFSDLSRTCPRTSGGWVPPLALMPKNNRSVSFLVA